MAFGLILGIGRAYRRQRMSSINILTLKTGPRDYYKGKNCKPTSFRTHKGGYVVVQEKLPNYVVPDLTDFKLKPYVSQYWFKQVNKTYMNVSDRFISLSIKPPP